MAPVEDLLPLGGIINDAVMLRPGPRALDGGDQLLLGFTGAHHMHRDRPQRRHLPDQRLHGVNIGQLADIAPVEEQRLHHIGIRGEGQLAGE